jgi:hypothetical protein
MTEYLDGIKEQISFLPAPHGVEKLAKALAAVQAEMPLVTRNVTGQAGPRQYKYADLSEINQHIMPLLGKNGLSFMCKPTMQGERMVLAYSLLHESGQREDGIYPLPNGVSPQALGSAITYGRRYCLCAVTGIAADEDDDGQAAAQKPAESKPERAPAKRRQSQDWQAYNEAKGPQPPAEAAPEPKPVSPAQEYAEMAERIVDINGTVDELRKNVYDMAAPAGCLPTRVRTRWNADEMPLSWVLTEAKRRVRDRELAGPQS